IFDFGNYCYAKNILEFSNLYVNQKDTIKLIAGNTNNEKEGSASFFITDIDAIVENYKPIDSMDFNNWLLIQYIDNLNTIIYGKFSCTYVTQYEDYLSGERERWDDPERPDTIHFEGSFAARR
ncbi:MAG: hypothetical protein KDD49_12510, partial [Bacteroidetes bacterium]|nr:hypothetical protein [Bacteroidota bacterium]